MNNQNCHEFWMLAESLKVNDIVALWCDQEPTEFNNFIQQSGFSPSCADAKRASLEDALLKGDLDYIDEGIPYNGNKLWTGGEVSELIQKNRLRIEKAELRRWFDLKYTSGQLKEIPTFLDEEKQRLQLLQQQRESETSADEELNLKDSAYHLISVLKDLLLNPDTNAYHFKTDNSKSTNQPTQAGLAEYIDAMNIKGLKSRNINGIFSDANRLLNDARKN